MPDQQEAPTGVLLPEGLAFFTRYVGRDSQLEEYDRVLADCRLEGKFIFQIGFHAPVGKLQKGKAYQLGKEARIKRVQGNRVEIFLNGEDVAAGVDYSSKEEPAELPW